MCVWWRGVIFWCTLWNTFLFFTAPLARFCSLAGWIQSDRSSHREVPCRHFRAAWTFGSAWLLFLLDLLQLSGVLIIEKIWMIEDLILVQASYTCSHIFTWRDAVFFPGMDISAFVPARDDAYVELSFEGREPYLEHLCFPHLLSRCCLLLKSTFKFRK